MSIKTTIPVLESPSIKPKSKKIDINKFELLAKKVKGYLEEEEKKLIEKENEYNTKLRLSFGH